MGERTIGSNAQGSSGVNFAANPTSFCGFGFVGGREYDSLTMTFFCGWVVPDGTLYAGTNTPGLMGLYILFWPIFPNPPHVTRSVWVRLLVSQGSWAHRPYGKAAANSCSHRHDLAGLPTYYREDMTTHDWGFNWVSFVGSSFALSHLLLHFFGLQSTFERECWIE